MFGGLLLYFAIGATVAYLQRGMRRDEDAILWTFERITGWPFYGVAGLMVAISRFRARVRSRIFSRPPKWYDFLFFWT